MSFFFLDLIHSSVARELRASEHRLLSFILLMFNRFAQIPSFFFFGPIMLNMGRVIKELHRQSVQAWRETAERHFIIALLCF